MCMNMVYLWVRVKYFHFHTRCNFMRLCKCERRGKLQVQRQLDAISDFEHRHVVYLPHAWVSHRGRFGALTQRIRFAGLDVDDDVGSRNSALDRLLNCTSGASDSIATRAASWARDGTRSMSTSTFCRISRDAARTTRAATKSAAI